MSVVQVDPNQCIGCGVCAALCSAVFRISPDNGKAMIIPEANLELDCVKEAEEACPVAAITIN